MQCSKTCSHNNHKKNQTCYMDFCKGSSKLKTHNGTSEKLHYAQCSVNRIGTRLRWNKFNKQNKINGSIILPLTGMNWKYWEKKMTWNSFCSAHGVVFVTLERSTHHLATCDVTKSYKSQLDCRITLVCVHSYERNVDINTFPQPLLETIRGLATEVPSDI